MLESLSTEKRNQKTLNLDELSVQEILQIMNEEDENVPKAVGKALPSITKLVDEAVKVLNQGGRIVYAGAGTSGRLGVLDAVECYPTFSAKDEFVGLMAGGEKAFVRAVEGAEDSEELGRNDLKNINFSSKDIIIGIAASGRTPYVKGCLEYGSEVGAPTACVCCNIGSVLSKYADVPVEVDCGPEVLTGSTRLKSGTAQKLILNMISTTSMIKYGKVYKNLMVDLRCSNEKLQNRAIRIVSEATGVSFDEAKEFTKLSGGEVKTAIVMILVGCSAEKARERLKDAKGIVRKAI